MDNYDENIYIKYNYIYTKHLIKFKIISNFINIFSLINTRIH